jgi:aryl sulfotransferase
MTMDQFGNGIVWMASYPRSGNTWLRIFLANLLSEDSEGIDINELNDALDGVAIASHRKPFDDIAGIDSSELTPDEIDILRPRIYEAIAAANDKPLYVKVHDAFLLTPDGEPLMPVKATRAAVYIVRNPLDVAVSIGFFSGYHEFDLTIAQMADPDRVLSFRPDMLSEQLRQRLSTWSGHVTSWVDTKDIKCHIIRYEDMVQNPLDSFTAIVRFLGLPYDSSAIRNAIERARFDTLRGTEERRGFAAKPVEAQVFFREGRVGGWRDYLSASQATKIVADHRTVMERLGYLNKDGSPRF